MNLVKDEYIKNIILGLYEVLDIAGCELKDAEKTVLEVKEMLKSYEFSDEDFSNSQYTYVVFFLKQVGEWSKIEKTLSNTIKEVLKTVDLDSRET